MSTRLTQRLLHSMCSTNCSRGLKKQGAHCPSHRAARPVRLGRVLSAQSQARRRDAGLRGRTQALGQSSPGTPPLPPARPPPLARVRPFPPPARAARYVPEASDPARAAAARPISAALTGWLPAGRRGLGGARTWTGRPAGGKGGRGRCAVAARWAWWASGG